MNKSYLYIAAYYDKMGRDVSINDKKIGITKSPNEREKSLNYTKGPIGTTFIKLYEFEGDDVASIIEKNVFHNLLSHRNTDGEWFNDDDDSIVEMVETFIFGISPLLKVKEVQIDGRTAEEVQTVRSAAKKLSVILNGIPITEKSAKDIYIKTLQQIGLDVVFNLELLSYIRKEDPDYRFTKVGEYYINTNISNEGKCSALIRIAKSLNIDLKAELV